MASRLILPILRLIRLPNGFSVASNVMAATLLFGGSWLQFSFFLLLGSSLCLYFGGMVDNDLADLDEDRKLRPERVLPAGQVSVQIARTIRMLLFVSGLGLAASTLKLPVVMVSCALVGTIWFYNHQAKSKWYGSLVMAACRFLNIYMIAFGLFPWENASQADTVVPHLYPFGMGFYIGGITLFAETEETLSQRSRLVAATLVIAIGLLFFLATGIADLENFPQSLLDFRTAVFGLLLFPVLRSLVRAIQQPVPKNVQYAVIRCLQSLIVLDAFLCFTRSDDARWIWVLALLLPAALLGRWIRGT